MSKLDKLKENLARERSRTVKLEEGIQDQHYFTDALKRAREANYTLQTKLPLGSNARREGDEDDSALSQRAAA